MPLIKTILKKSIPVAAAGCLFFSGCMGIMTIHEQQRHSPAPAVQQQESDYQELNAYGEWIDVERIGRVWRPFAAAEWRPFTYGHWTSSSEGWTWVSYEPFGWIVYHYGNWTFSPDYGWVWVPAQGDWSPACVQWVQYDDYIAWAPLPIGHAAWPQPWERNNTEVWTVVRTGDFTRDNVGTFRAERKIIQNGQPRREQAAPRPPERRVIEERTKQAVPTVVIQREAVAGRKSGIRKMSVPESEVQRVEKNKPKVEKEVLQKRGERKNTEERKTEPGR
jgi:hypothetical protein